MEKKPLTDFDADILNAKIVKIKSDIPLKVLYVIIFVSMLVFLPGKRVDSKSLYNKYGFWKPASILILLFAGHFYRSENKILKKLKNDLSSNEKIVEKNVVWKKAKSFSVKKYLVYVDSNHHEFMKFEISEENYNRIEKGHTVFIEYAEHSKVLLDLKLNMTDNKTNS